MEFKDTVIKDKFQEFNRLDGCKVMFGLSNSWRKEIIKNSIELDYKTVCVN